MNDRAQAGSGAFGSGNDTIQLMQNRRLMEDDNKGVIEPLDEMDNDGNGIQVSAKYYMHIFDTQKGHSLQRKQQILTDQALQYAYSFDYRLPEKGVETSVSKSIEVPDSIVYRVMPLEKQKLLVRLENLADKFDGSDSAHFDLEKLA